jgi:hypothetical protein
MRGLAILVIAVAACSRDGGVVIVVDTSPAVAHVRLYVGQGAPQHTLYLQTSATAASAAAPAANRVANPTYFARDPFNSTDVVDLATPGDSVSFTFVDAGQHAIPAIIAVGYDASFAVVGTAFMSVPAIADDNNFTLYHLQLHAPVTQLDGVSERQLGLWSTDPQTPVQDADCAGLVADAPGLQTKTFIVTDGDEDCDGLPTGRPDECDPDAYLSTRPATRDEMSCLAQHADPQSAVTNCYLGGPSCTDGQPHDANACDPTTYCVPIDVCVACPPSKPGSLDCATTPPSTPAVTSYTCRVAFSANGDACADPIEIERPPTGGFNCNSVAIRDGRGEFDDNAEFGGKLRFDVQLDQGCNVTFEPSGKRPVMPFSGSALLALQLDNGNGLGIPITFIDDPAPCGAPVKCIANSPLYAPVLTQCMARWQPPTQVPLMLPTATTEISDPSLPDDMTELYFVADGVILVSARDPNTNAWTLATPVFSTPIGGMDALEAAPNITPDGLTLYFVVSTATMTSSTVYVSTRPDRMAPWATPTILGQVPGAITITEVSPDETETHFIAAVNGMAGGNHLVELVKTATSYSTQMIGLGINSMNDVTPCLSPDGLHLYFASDAITTGNVGLELFVASRNAITDPFQHPVWLSELGGTASDRAPWVSRDGHTMYFVSARDNGNAEIFVTHR